MEWLAKVVGSQFPQALDTEDMPHGQILCLDAMGSFLHCLECGNSYPAGYSADVSVN